MRDLNFFESYLDKRKFNINKKLIYYRIIILLLIFLILYTISNQIKIRKISKDIVKLKLVAHDERINKKVEEITEEEKKVKELQASLNEIKLIDGTLEEISIIDDSLLKSITSRIPKKLFFTSISMHPDNIEIIGIAQDKQSIAELGKSLETIDGFKEVFISNISKKEIYYKFNLNINLKDVRIDEDDGTTEDSEVEETVE